MRPVNLIPDEQRRRPSGESSGKGAYALLGVLAALLVMVAIYVLTSNQVTERRNEAAVAGAEADRLEAEAAKRNNYTDFAQIAQTRLASVAGVAETRFDWERLMRELALVMPEGTWLQSTEASASGDASAGGQPATPSAAGAGPSANLVGCTPRPPDVARMMVRLRQLHRVNDVSLNESSREQASTPATVDSCGSLYKFDLTVSFDPTEAASEAPRGATRVPASLGGGS